MGTTYSDYFQAKMASTDRPCISHLIPKESRTRSVKSMFERLRGLYQPGTTMALTVTFVGSSNKKYSLVDDRNEELTVAEKYLFGLGAHPEV